MNLKAALAQLRAWCDESNGTPIELLPGRPVVFESRSLHTREELQAAESQLNFRFPDSYHAFMQTIGACALFSWSPQGGGPRFYTPREVIAASSGASYVGDHGREQRLCFVGEHRLMGDLMGFLTNRPGELNFDIFCHEYRFEEYVAVSDELNSWRSFEQWLIRTVASRGEESI